jgi:uncharacterized protein with NRDE domain
MGVTKHGKLAVLTNYREDKSSEAIGVYSRGLIVNSWLTGPTAKEEATREFVQAIVASPEAKQVGGFSLVCGHINEPLAIVSNRSSDMDHITWVATEKNQTRGLSNTTVDDRTWPKILDGERLMEAAIQDHASRQTEDEDDLIEQLLQVLSTDTLPRLSQGETLDTYIICVRAFIFPSLEIQTNVSKLQTPQPTGSWTKAIPLACMEHRNRQSFWQSQMGE